MKTRIKTLKITTLFQTNIWNITIKKSSLMRKFKKLKLLRNTGILTDSMPSTDSFSTPLKKPNSLKKEMPKPKFTDKMR